MVERIQPTSCFFHIFLIIRYKSTFVLLWNWRKVESHNLQCIFRLALIMKSVSLWKYKTVCENLRTKLLESRRSKYLRDMILLVITGIIYILFIIYSAGWQTTVYLSLTWVETFWLYKNGLFAKWLNYNVLFYFLIYVIFFLFLSVKFIEKMWIFELDSTS